MTGSERRSRSKTPNGRRGARLRQAGAAASVASAAAAAPEAAAAAAAAASAEDAPLTSLAYKGFRSGTFGSSGCSEMRDRRSFDLATGIFLLAWIWHIQLLPLLYDLIGRDVAATLALFPNHIESFKERHGLRDREVNRDFAFIAAFSHTIVFLFGLFCSAMMRRAGLLQIFKRERELQQQQGEEKSRLHPIGAASTLALLLWVTAVFHRMAWAFLRFCFDTRFSIVFNYADLFFNSEEGGDGPFAWTSSVSYSTALFLGMLLNVGEHAVELGQDSADKRRAGVGGLLWYVHTWVSAIGLPFIVWAVTLDKVTLPFLSQMDRSNETDVSLANLTAPGKSIAYVLGMCLCCATPTVWAVLDAVYKAARRWQCGEHKGFFGEVLACTWVVLRTFFVSLAISAAFLTLSLHSEFSVNTLLFAAHSLCEVFLQQRFVGVTVLTVSALLGLLFALTKNPRRPRDELLNLSSNSKSNGASESTSAPLKRSVLDWAPEFVKYQVAFWFISFLMNAHLCGFWGSFLPHQLYALVVRNLHHSVDYPWTEALMDGWNTVIYGLYAPPIVLQAMAKIITARMGASWGVKQELFLALCFTLPLSWLLHHYWVNDKPGTPVLIVMSVLHYFYLVMTWGDRPENTGTRNWPACRRWGCWELVQWYFDQHIIVEAEDGSTAVNTQTDPPGPAAAAAAAPWTRNRSNHDYNEKLEGHKPVPRIIGMTPHGILPASLLWFHITPRWRSVFGSLCPCSMTDAFIHCMPFAREIAQWTGGLEVSKDNVTHRLALGETIAMIPGGQGEILLHTGENFKQKRAVVCDKHKGFCRIALIHGAEVVPMFTAGELQCMQNISMPAMQNFTRKLLGFPFPFFPVGVLGILPFPNRVPFTFIFGKPLKGTCKVPGKPSEEEVDDLHARFYTEMMRIANKHKAQAGMADWTIITRSTADAAPAK